LISGSRNMTNNETIEFPPLIEDEDQDWTTRPIPLEELPVSHRMSRAMGLLEEHHQRIAKAVSAIWGHRECSLYLQRLIMNGGEGAGRDRVGFKPAILSALITLDLLHDKEFGVL